MFRAPHGKPPLPQGVVEAFNVIGFAGLLRNGFVLLRRNHPRIGFILIRMERGLLTVSRRDIGPELFGTPPTAIPHVKRNGSGWPWMPQRVRLLRFMWATAVG